MQYGILGYFMEHYALGVLRLQPEHFEQMPCNGLTLAVFIGCEPYHLGFVSGLLQLLDEILLVR